MASLPPAVIVDIIAADVDASRLLCVVAASSL